MPKKFGIDTKNLKEKIRFAGDVGKIFTMMAAQEFRITDSYQVVYPTINHLLALRQYYVSAPKCDRDEYIIWAFLSPNIFEDFPHKSIYSLHLSELNAGAEFNIVGLYSCISCLGNADEKFFNPISSTNVTRPTKPWNSVTNIIEFFLREKHL